MGLGDFVEGEAGGDWESGPAGFEGGVEVAGGLELGFRGEIVAAEEEGAGVFEDHWPDRELGWGGVGGVGGDRAAGVEKVHVGVNIGGEGDFDDVVYAIGSDGVDACGQIGAGENDFVGAGVFCGGLVGGRANGADDAGAGEAGELDGAEADGAAGSLDENGAAGDRSGDVDGAVRGDAGNAETGALVHGDIFGERCDVVEGNAGELGGGAEGAIGLGGEAPDVAAEPFGGDAGAEEVNASGAVAVRDDARVRHAEVESVFAFFGVAGIDAGGGDADANFAWGGGGIGHIADDEDVAGRALLFIPGGFHGEKCKPGRRLRLLQKWKTKLRGRRLVADGGIA